MTSVAVLVPVLRRPHRVKPLLESLGRSMAGELTVEWEIVFVCSPGDRGQTDAVRAAGFKPVVVGWTAAGPGDYARKINHAARATNTEWLFTGADDLRFHPGWMTEALRVHDETGALVVGTNDLGNSAVLAGRHATHSLVHRAYLPHAVADKPGDLYCESYDHNCVDVELTETAQANGTWAFAKDSVVEHEHWMWRKAERDATYRKGIRRASQDRKLLASRRHLWQTVAA